MAEEYGFTLNMSAVVNKDGKLSLGVKANDTNGFDVDVQRDNVDVESITDTKSFMQDFLDEIEAAYQKKETEDNSVEGRLKRLEEENAKLRKQLEQTRLEKQAMRTSKPVENKKAESADNPMKKDEKKKPARRNSYGIFDDLFYDFGLFDKFLSNW